MIQSLKSIAFLLVMLSFVACNKEELPQVKNQLPVAVKRDFGQRFEGATVSSYASFSRDIEINFTDAEQNQSTAFYVDNRWSMTITELSGLEKLPWRVWKQLEQTPYADLTSEQVSGIERIERRGLSHALYTLKFIYPYQEHQHMYHEVLLNEDGKLLLVHQQHTNDQRNFVSLVQPELDYIEAHYAGADIRCYINDGGYDRFLFLHDGVLKSIYFDNNNRNTPDEWSWRKTTTPLSPDAPIPSDVLEQLKAIDSEFRYTEVIYIETPHGNGYMFIDGTSANRLGYTIGDWKV